MAASKTIKPVIVILAIVVAGTGVLAALLGIGVLGLRHPVEHKVMILYPAAEGADCEFLFERQQIDSVVDFRSARVREFALPIAARQPGEFHLVQALDIYDSLRLRWRYVSDPDGEEAFAAASSSIASGYAGDCDDFAATLSASLIAVGARVRLNHVYSDSSGHAYAELDLGSADTAAVRSVIRHRYTQLPPGYRVGRFLTLDWQEDYPGAPAPQARSGIRYSLPHGGCTRL